ncbi:hypothetical protein [Streptomyces anulatus]|uniref:hypothetical protein n=1 Tax=Streptomyces anulatus TaxID=1892 RepID=UPI00255D032E|nr:hypothetical protein [Streptomyces anulatus]WIY76399.1 hypothetical protein QPM16_12360 [Streptomyces anulatus]
MPVAGRKLGVLIVVAPALLPGSGTVRRPGGGVAVRGRFPARAGVRTGAVARAPVRRAAVARVGPFRIGAFRDGTLRPGTFRLRAIGLRALGLRALGTGLLGTGAFRFADAARGAVDDHEGVVLRLPHPFAVLAPPALGLVLVAALDDGGVGGDRAGVGVGGESHPDAYGDGFAGGNGEPAEPVAGAVGARARTRTCAGAGVGRRPRLAFLPALRLLAPVVPLAAEDTDLLVAVGALPGDPVFDPGAAGLGELQLDLVRGQPAVAVGEDEDRVQGAARRVGGVGEVEEPGAVAAAGGIPVRGVLDPGLDGEVLGIRVTADGLPVGG